MPYDPNWPQNGELVDGDRFRDQFAGLKTLIDAVQSGGISAVAVDNVQTLPAGSAATVGVSLVGSELRFSFGIPAGQQGSEGPQGIPGNNGSDGAPGLNGNDGQQGPPFAQAVVDAVNTLDPGQPASVGVSFDGSNVRFTFGLPRGQDGSNGSDGAPGAAGEVSTSQLNNAISGTSNNSNGVSMLSLNVSDPPTQSDVQVLANKLDELINALRR